jgi:hypothetical protein
MSTNQPSLHRTVEPRRALRFTAAALAGVIALTYLVLFFLVADAERGAPENTFGAYLFLFLAYAVGAVLLALRSGRAVMVLGAGVQLAVLVLFTVFGVGLLGPGVFAYELLRPLHMEVWAAGITAAQVLLLVLMTQLAVSSTHERIGVGTARRTG